METKELKIQVPEGYEIDKENSTFECIKFKPIKNKLTYEDVAEELFKDKRGFFTNKCGEVCPALFNEINYLDSNNCTSEKQAEKLLAINKLMNVAKFLNGDWKPNWNESDKKYAFIIKSIGRIDITYWHKDIHNIVYFKSVDLAQQAIEILGEETIKLALSTDW